MRKKIYIDDKAEKELVRFSEIVQEEFEKRFEVLRSEGKLEFPEARKITKNLFEIRIKFQGAYRGFYAYVSRSGIK